MTPSAVEHSPVAHSPIEQSPVEQSPVEHGSVGHPVEAGAKSRIVLVDVRPARRGIMRGVVDLALGEGTVVGQVANVTEALGAVERYRADIAIVEIQLPVADGLALIAALRAAQPELAIVVCTFHADAATQLDAAAAGADLYLVKPLSARSLRTTLASVRRTPLAGTPVG